MFCGLANRNIIVILITVMMILCRSMVKQTCLLSRKYLLNWPQLHPVWSYEAPVDNATVDTIR